MHYGTGGTRPCLFGLETWAGRPCHDYLRGCKLPVDLHMELPRPLIAGGRQGHYNRGTMGWSRFSFVICFFMWASLTSAEPKAWQLDPSGHWIESRTLPTSAPAPEPLLDRAQRLLDARQYDPAHDILLDWLKKHPKKPTRARALLMMAELYFALDERVESFYQCDELLDNFPDSKLYFQTLELQYRIADAYLGGYKNKFLWLPVLSMDDVAIEMMFRIQERVPGSPLAERALARSADYYYRSSQFDLAADAYGAFLRMYPRSPSVPRARLRQAYSNFAQFRGPLYDATPLLDARAQFLDIIARDPDLAREEGVQQFIDRIDEQLATKLYLDAGYYERVHQPKAAVFLYRSLIQRYPNSREAKVARDALSRMPAWALSDPLPPHSAGRIPTTRPLLDVR